MLQIKNRLILASQSPRRKELLDQMGIKDTYEIIPSQYEEILDSARNPEDVAQELGYGKALWVAKRNPNAWVIGSDTIVTIEGKQLGKAADRAQAFDMLKMLAGRTNTVTSSVVLIRATEGDGMTSVMERQVGFENAVVHFKPYDKSAIDVYLATNDWKDKAGSYGIQSGAHTLIDSIEGNYDAIVGLPTRTLAAFLAEIGISAQPVILQAPVPVTQAR